jgi:hypothetical protein
LETIKDLASKKIEGSKLFVFVILMNGAEQKKQKQLIESRMSKEELQNCFD